MNQEKLVRRLLSTIAAMAAAGIIIPAATAVPVAQAAVVPQRLGLRLVQARGSAAHNPRARRYIVGYLRPGTVIHRSILIDNLGSATAHVAVYSGAARIRNGSFLASAGQTRSKLTSWIALRKSTYHLRRGASVTDLVTIRVPRQATPGDPGDLGEHYGVIWVQQVTHARGGAATKVSRVGIRIYLAVGRRAAPPTRFTVTSVTGHRYAGGRPLLTASVTNTGGRAVDLSGSARLTAGPGPSGAGPFQQARVITLAPGQSGTLTFAAGRQLPSGPWRDKVTLVSGLTRVTAAATIDFSAHPAGPARSRTAAMVGSGGLGIALVALIMVWARRRRGLPASRELA
ncbi:MAG TPA: hypothetical protein VMV07_20395 [Streptosporangiaceae bacterium]|nr:hypothetical protein [Streptosporangiaceae bacterium]